MKIQIQHYFKKLKKDREMQLLTGVVVAMVLVPLTIFGYIAMKSQQDDGKRPFITPTPAARQQDDQDESEDTEATPTKKVTNTPRPTPTPTKTVTSTPAVPTNTPGPTVTPTHTSNPPQMKITYPTEGQLIELGAGQSFCLVDVPDGGNQEELKRRHKINEGSFTGYDALTTLCYEPTEGQNKILLQYRNKFGDESQQYTRNFTFHRTS